MANKFYGAVGLTGGGTGALDAIDGADLSDGDGAIVITSDGVRLYLMDGDSGATESSPGVISPDTNAGTKRWILQDVRAAEVIAGGSGVGDGSITATSSGGGRTAVMGAKDSGSYICMGSLTDHAFNIVRNAVREWLFDATGLRPSDDNALQIGDATHRLVEIWAVDDTINSSDSALKDQVADTRLGLDFILALTPKEYKWKDHEIPAKRDIFTNEVKEPARVKTHKRKHHGLIAQDVEKVLAKAGVSTQDFAGLIIDEESGRYGLRYGEFMAPMIKAIQDIANRLEALEARMDKVEGKA